MKLLLPLVLGGCLVTGLSTFSYYQSNTIDAQKEKLTKSIKEKETLLEDLEIETQTNEDLLSENFELEDKVDELRDSIQTLKYEIIRLRKKIKSQSAELSKCHKTAQETQADYAAIKEKIAALVKSNDIDKNQIAALEAEKAQLREQIEFVEQEKIKIALAKTKSEEEIQQTEENMINAEAEINKQKFHKLATILNNTKIHIESISFRKKRFGGNMKRLKKKSWKYTIINFYLDNDDLKLLVDEKFVLKIIDQDKNEVLAYVEDNPNFPDNQLKIDGLQFKFDGNLIEIVHYNNETKQSKNYEVQLFYMDGDGEENMLLDGAFQIVKDGKPIKDF